MTGSDFDLDTRAGLPPDLAQLLARYPRDTWPTHRNLGQTAKFWLSRHDMFRELGHSLGGALEEHREGRLAFEPFRRWFAPRLNFFLRQLEHHHQIEDLHYFPVFQKADAELSPGFELLEGDHETIHGDLVAMAEAANRLLAAEDADVRGLGDAAKRAADAYAGSSDRLLRRLVRHLADEEDLIIPLILDRGEAGLGI